MIIRISQFEGVFEVLPQLDMPWFFVGILIALCVIAGVTVIIRNMPNPYGEPLYHIRFPQYGFWSRKAYPADLPLFTQGDMVRLVLTTEANANLFDVLVVEPNDGRQMRIPKACLKPGSDFDAWRYRRWYEFNKGSDAMHKSLPDENE